MNKPALRYPPSFQRKLESIFGHERRKGTMDDQRYALLKGISSFRWNDETFGRNRKRHPDFEQA